MSKGVSGTGPAFEQIREVIAILRELANAGPRDNSFKQWRQVTLTLLQRIWPGDQTRAVRFRRIPFSPPSSRADTKTVRDAYVRGVNEALSYLESLAAELDPGRRQLQRPAEAPVRPEPEAEAEPAAARRKLVLPPEAPLRPAPEPSPETERVTDDDRYVAPRPASPQVPPGPIEPSPWEAQSLSSAEGAGSPPPQAQAAAPPAAMPAPTPAEPSSAKGPRARLKDMLGFGDESDPPVDETEAQSQMPGATPRQPAPPAAAPPAAAAPIPAPAAAPIPTPVAAPAAAPVAAPPPSAPPAAASPPPAAGLEEQRATPRPAPPQPAAPAREPEAASPERARTAAPPPATLREMLDRQITPPPAPPMRASREVRAMAAAVDQLGVPRERHEIVRAALLDLGQQMDAPQAEWAALRQGMTFLMEYPQIARRVIPMLLPYLDEAA